LDHFWHEDKNIDNQNKIAFTILD